MDEEEKPLPSYPIYRVPTVNLCRPTFNFGTFFNPSVFYGTPVMPNAAAQHYSGFRQNYQPSYPSSYPTFRPQFNIPTPPTFPTLPNFGSPYFSEQRLMAEAGPQPTPPPTTPQMKSIFDIKYRSELVELLMFNGIDPIPVSDPPLLFNKYLSTKTGLIGVEHVAQVICQAKPDYETYLCRLCEFWNAPAKMAEHLQTEDHRLLHMRKKFKDHFHKIKVARKRDRQALIDKIVNWISLVEDAKVVKRTRTVLNSNILLKVWPQFLDEFDDSWKGDGDKKKDTEIITLESDSDTEAMSFEVVESVPPQMESQTFMQPPTCQSDLPPSLRSSKLKNVKEEIEEGEISLSPDLKNACVCALIFIRDEAISKKGIQKDKVERICKLLGVSTKMVFSDEVLEYAGEKIGDVKILVAIVEHIKNPGIPLAMMLQKVGADSSSPPAHPSTILMGLGVSKSKIAKLIRSVDMILKIEVETQVDPATVFQRKSTKQPLIQRFDRAMVLYDGEYIEAHSRKIKQENESFAMEH